MNLQYRHSYSGKGKVAVIILGVVILLVGLISHYESEWKRIYKLNDVSVWRKNGFDLPRLSIEEYYVAMVIISLILSLVSTALSFLKDTTTGRIKLVDFGYHLLIALLLLIAGSLYISSAKQIGKYTWLKIDGSGQKMLIGLKIFAGSLTIIQTIFYVVVAFLIWKEM